MRALIALLLLLPSLAQAGAWTRDFGSIYAKLEEGVYVAGRYVDPHTAEPIEGRYVGARSSVYVEAGVFPLHPVQVTISAPFLLVSSVWFSDERLFGPEAEAKASSVRAADLDIAVQASLLPPKLPFKLAASFGVKAPMYSNDRVGEEFGVWQDAFPLPGDGQVDVQGLLLFGGGLSGEIAPWFEGFVGYRHRTEAFVYYTTDRELVDSVPFGAVVGLKLPKGWVGVRAEGNVNVQEDDDTRQGLSVGLFGAVALGKGLSIEGRFSGEPWVAAASQGVAFGLGVSWQR